MPALKSVPPYYLRWSKKTGLCPSSTSNTVLGIQLRKNMYAFFYYIKPAEVRNEDFSISHILNTTQPLFSRQSLLEPTKSVEYW